MKTRKTSTTIAVIGEGATEKYYLKSLEGVIHAQVKPEDGMVFDDGNEPIEEV